MAQHKWHKEIVAWASSYATIEPSSKMLLLYHAIDKALKEKNHGQ